MTTEGRRRTGWESSPHHVASSPSLSPPRRQKIKSPHKKSAFITSEIEESGNISEHYGHERHPRKAKQHTSIEVEKDFDFTPGDRPSGSKITSRKGLRRRGSDFNGRSDGEESVIDSQPEVRGNFEGGTSDTEGGNAEITINKTTTALLLAKEASQILGSPVNQDG